MLLVDDADSLASRGQGFADGFFEAARTLVQRGSLTWVSASRHSLYDAFKSRGLTSRFLNDALKLRVGALSTTAAHELARRAGAEVAARMVDAAGGFAYGLQWLGDFVCRRPGQLEAACDACAEDVAAIFQGWWAELDAHQRQLVKRCLPGALAVAELDDRSRRRLRGLAERGLVVERNARFAIDGETWRGFVADAE